MCSTIKDSRFSRSKKEKRSIYKIPVNTKVFTGTFPVPLKAFIPASVSFFLLYFGPNHHSAPFIRNPLMLCLEMTFGCVFLLDI